MKLVAYIDESGRHDKSGNQTGSPHVVVAGWLDWQENWAIFCDKWQSVLNNYKIEYFHFYEWADASAVARNKRKPTSSYPKNPYRHLSHE